MNTTSGSQRLARLDEIEYRAADIVAKNSCVKATAARESRNFMQSNFDALSPADVRIVFAAIDREFFEGSLAPLFDDTGSELGFEVSGRMSSSAGRVVAPRVRRTPSPSASSVVTPITIQISAPVLFSNFHGDDASPVYSNGLLVADRLEAAINVVQHEVLHAIEYACSGHSSHGRWFRGRAAQLFGHTDWRHKMITPIHRAQAQSGLRPGDRVAFTFDGRILEGHINRITTRATVLVPSSGGRPYSDGGRYAKYYVPTGALRKIG